nr:putative ribonuclease H-like domain-containing protein [Tanacetum cinerariifolium]
AYSDSDYAGASLDRKSTIEGCQFRRCKLISWQCKKQIVVATSSTEAEVGKGCSRIETLLFKGMIVAQQVGEDADKVSVDDVPADKLERRNKLKVSKLRRLKRVGTYQKVETSDDTVMDDVSKQERMIADMDADIDVTLKDIAKDVTVDAKIKESTYVPGRQAESQAQIYQIDLEHADKVLNMQDDEVEPAELQEVVEVVTTANLITKVVTTASTTITAC